MNPTDQRPDSSFLESKTVHPSDSGPVKVNGVLLTATMVAGTLLSGGDNLASNVAPGTR